MAENKAAFSFERANILRAAALSLRSPERAAHAQIYYHAALAISVATWDAYLKDVVIEFHAVVANPLNQQFHAMATLSKRSAEFALRRFNTPNFQNSRELLVGCTGYDPYSDWTWRQRSMTVFHVEERLNQILKVRHSFAHGFAIPAFAWTQSYSGKVRLTSRAIVDTIALLRHLIKNTDGGLKLHIVSTYKTSLTW
jgi:RiboL-PSP-HEPN